MCVSRIKWILVTCYMLTFVIAVTNCKSTSAYHRHDASKTHEATIGKGKKLHNVARTNIVQGGKNSVAKGVRSSKRQDVGKLAADLLSQSGAQILEDEIKRSDQAANSVEMAFNIPKENAFLDTSMKEGDNIDTDTANMIDYNAKKGAYLPVSTAVEPPGGNNEADKRKILTEQFGNITGLPEFMLVKKPKRKSKNVSLVDTVADALQPTSSAFTGIKQLLEETKVEQSLKKGLDAVPSLGRSISPDFQSLPVQLDKVPAAINSMPVSEGVPLASGYTTPINPDEVFDESVSPPEQLLDELSAGRFKHPLSESVLNKMSNWNANKEYLMDNGYMQKQQTGARLSRVSSDVVPVHDVYTKTAPISPTFGIPRGVYNILGRDPEVLGRNQQFLNKQQYHSISDLDSIGVPVYPGNVVHLPHHQRPKHVVLPFKHVVAHFNGGPMFEDVEDGVRPWHFEDDEGSRYHHHNHHHRHSEHVIEETDEPDDEESFIPGPKVHSARCSHKPCFNGGRCTALTDRYVCTCREGFYGANCEKRSLCFPNPCRHGSCSSNPDNFICTCQVGWQGQRCDERDKCHPSPCMHGGTCSSITSGVYCTCAPGFKGKYCEAEAKCSPLNPCVNGGRCQEMPFTYVCVCKKGYSGRNCDDVLSPTAIPPTVGVKPVPPQPIPVPRDQPPFLLDELNSLSSGPYEEHAIPVQKIDATTTTEEQKNHHHHISVDRPEPISAPAAVIIHTGDPSKAPPKKNVAKKKKTPPKDIASDDRFQTHLVAAGVVNGKPADDEKTKADSKKPPMETPEQVKAKPTQKEDNRPKQLVPTAEILKRLENPHPVENQVYMDTPKKLFTNKIGRLVMNKASSVRPMTKHTVSKETKPNRVLPSIAAKQHTGKPMKLLQHNKLYISTHPVIQIHGKSRDYHVKKHDGKSAMPMKCPTFCNEFCDKWCIDVGCCKKMEVSGPTSAFDIAYENYQLANNKGGKHSCLVCSANADCVKGVCKCKRGFTGDGINCDGESNGNRISYAGLQSCFECRLNHVYCVMSMPLVNQTNANATLDLLVMDALVANLQITAPDVVQMLTAYRTSAYASLVTMEMVTIAGQSLYPCYRTKDSI
eukprot:gene12273-13538_t